MPQIKIHPAKQLPEQSISQQEFEDWQNKLEIYLDQDENMARFMSDGRYSTCQSQEENPQQLQAVHDRDPGRPAADAANRADLLTELLAKRRRELRRFIR